MRDFHYVAFVRKSKNNDPTNVADCLARMIRESDYHRRIGLPALMLNYVNVFDNKNKDGNMAIEINNTSYIIDSTKNKEKHGS